MRGVKVKGGENYEWIRKWIKEMDKKMEKKMYGEWNLECAPKK